MNSHKGIPMSENSLDNKKIKIKRKKAYDKTLGL